MTKKKTCNFSSYSNKCTCKGVIPVSSLCPDRGKGKELEPTVIPQVSKEIQPAILGMFLLDCCRPFSWVYSCQGKFGKMQDLVKSKVQKFLGMSGEQVVLAQQMSICIND